jgi:hypothetical protein
MWGGLFGAPDLKKAEPLNIIKRIEAYQVHFESSKSLVTFNRFTSSEEYFLSTLNKRGL